MVSVASDNTVCDTRGMDYRPLPADTIRLLRIRKDAAADYAGALVIAKLTDAPPYYTLSYCWGTDPQNIPIRVGEGTMCINSDLALGLRRLRELAGGVPELDHQIQYVWIDRICINQNDVSERSSQVCLMGEIYSRSIRTLIWLGPETASSSQAWFLIDRIYSVFKGQTLEATTLIDIPLKLFSNERHMTLGLPDLTHEHWAYLDTLLRLPWFTRIWVVQEVVLSSQDPIIVHGQHLYPWHRLGWAASWLRRNGYFRLPWLPEALRNVDEMSNIRRSQVRWPLDTLLTTTSVKFHASDQRDKVYGLLGIAAETQGITKMPAALQPDYCLTVNQVYLRTAKFLLHKHRSLALLIRTKHTSIYPGRQEHLYDFTSLPTWVPNWSDFTVFDREIAKSYSWISYSGRTQPAVLSYPDHCQASGGRPAQILETESDDILKVSGIKVDEVLHVFRFNQVEHMSVSFKEDFETITQRMLSSIASLVPSMGLISFIIQYIKTTTAEQYELGGLGLDQMLRDGAAYIYDSPLLHGVLLSTLLSPSGDLGVLVLLHRLSLGGNARAYVALARNFCFGRSLLITTSGKMGLGPASTSPGDSVCVLYGGGVPYILRRHLCSWELVGDSYFSGLMNAEAVSAQQQGKVTAEIFDIG